MNCVERRVAPEASTSTQHDVDMMTAIRRSDIDVKYQTYELTLFTIDVCSFDSSSVHRPGKRGVAWHITHILF